MEEQTGTALGCAHPYMTENQELRRLAPAQVQACGSGERAKAEQDAVHRDGAVPPVSGMVSG